MSNLVRVNVSRHKVTLEPEISPNLERKNSCNFQVTVTNLSDKFASFEIELYAKGSDANYEAKWYSVEPEICSKLQPGDRTDFCVIITKAPIPAYDTTIELTLKVFSVEYEYLYTHQTILLEIKEPKKPLQLHLPYKDIKAYPGDTLDIPVVISNFSSSFKELNIILEVRNADWFTQNITESISLESGNVKQIPLQLRLPETLTKSRNFYYFAVTAKYLQQNSASDSGNIEILPYGQIIFDCPEPRQKITRSLTKLVKKENDYSAKYIVQLENKSNVAQQVKFSFLDLTNKPFNPQPRISQQIKLEPAEQINEEIIVTQPQHRFGRTRRVVLTVIPIISNPNPDKINQKIQVKPNIQILELEIQSIVPFWLLIGCYGFLGLLILWLWLLFQPTASHDAPVYSVRLIGNGATVISGSGDTTIRHWQVNNCSWNWIRKDCNLQFQEKIIKKEPSHQPIRVIREIPEHEEQIAVGLEDGEIQLWRVLPPLPIGNPLGAKKKDRVFDLDFTKDSKYLFSGHGSGRLYQWEVSKNQYVQPIKKFQFGIAALSVISKLDEFSEKFNSYPRTYPKKSTNLRNNHESYLQLLKNQQPLYLDRKDKPSESYLVAVAGQYNKLALWKSHQNEHYEVNYHYLPKIIKNNLQPVFGSNDYINTLAFATKPDKSEILVTGDNQGFITLWDFGKLRKCMSTKKTPCDAILDQWQHGENFQPVYSVSLSDNACYLASAGSDGRVVLWQKIGNKNEYQKKPFDSLNGQKARSVDIKRDSDETVLIAAAQGNQVKVYRYKEEKKDDCK